MAELDSAYAPQKQQIQTRIDQLPSYYQAQQQGVEQARVNAFNDINNRANARGMAYSGAPIQEQQVYTGERYAPALAGLANQQNDQTYGLQQALAQLGTQQMTYAQDIRSKEMQLDEARRQFDQQMAAQREAEARAAAAAAKSAASSGFGNLFGGGGQVAAAPQAAQPQQLGAPQDLNGWQSLLDALKRSGLNYGQAIGEVYKRYGMKEGDIKNGSVADQAFRNVFLAPTPGARMSVQSVLPSVYRTLK